MNALSNNIWESISSDPYVYAIFDQTLILVEPGEDVSSVRLFLGPGDARTYRQDVIERLELRPSGILIGRINIKDVLDLKEELTVIAQECYEQPLKIVVTEMFSDVVLSEEEIYNSEVQIH